MKITQIVPQKAKHLIDELDRYQQALYPAESNHLDSIDALCKDNVFMVGAVENEQIQAIGAVKLFNDYGEIKRVYVPDKNRGKGLAKKIMAKLEDILIEHSIFTSTLETGIKQSEAIGLYEKLEYKECGPFGSYKADPLSVFMSKRLRA